MLSKKMRNVSTMMAIGVPTLWRLKKLESGFFPTMQKRKTEESMMLKKLRPAAMTAKIPNDGEVMV